MKAQLITGIIFILFSFSCNSEKPIVAPGNEIELLPGKIIGYDQCRRYDSFVIVVKNDTLVTFEDLDSLYGAFPEYYYEFYNWEFMFPEEERNKYPVHLNYNLVEEKDLKAFACNTYGDYREYSNHVRNRQIKINYITKLPLTKARVEK